MKDDELVKRLRPKFPSTLSSDQLREHFERMKTDLPTFVTQYMNKPARGSMFNRVVFDDVVDEAEERPTASGTMALIREASKRFSRGLFNVREFDLDEETLGGDPDDEEFKVEVSIKKLNGGHVLIRAGCQERVVHSLEELYSMVRALIRTNVPETLFLKGAK